MGTTSGGLLDGFAGGLTERDCGVFVPDEEGESKAYQPQDRSNEKGIVESEQLSVLLRCLPGGRTEVRKMRRRAGSKDRRQDGDAQCRAYLRVRAEER